MYLFERSRVLQVHFNKTAGTSLRACLESAFGEQSQMVHGKHNSVREAFKIFGDSWHFVTTIRNPYERLVSLQAHRKKRFLEGERGLSTGRLKNAHDLTFKDWLYHDLLPSYRKGVDMDQPLSKLLSISQPALEKIALIKVENFSAEMTLFLKKFKIECSVPNMCLNTSPHLYWRQYYDEEALRIVFEWDRWVFECFYPELIP